MVATLLDVVIGTLTCIDFVRNGDADVALHDGKGLKLKITIAAISIVHNLAWDIVMIVMLVVFVKYGQPIEKDAQTLVHNHMLAVQ